MSELFPAYSPTNKGELAADYISTNFSSLVTEALEHILETRPPRPVDYLAKFLQAHHPLRTIPPLKVRTAIDTVKLTCPRQREAAAKPASGDDPVKPASFTRAGVHRLYYSFAPSIPILKALCEQIKDDFQPVSEAASSQPSKTPPFIQFVVFQRNEVVFVNDLPYVGTLASQMLDANDPLDAAAEILLETILEDPKKSCDALKNVLRDVADHTGLKQSTRVLGAPEPFRGLPLFNMCELPLVEELHQVVSTAWEANPQTVFVILTFESYLEPYVRELAAIPAIFLGVTEEVRRKERLSRAAKEADAGAAQQETLRETALARLVELHEKVMKRRAEREAKRQQSRNLTLPVENSQRVEDDKLFRRAKQQQRYDEIVAHERGTAILKIQTQFRGHRVRQEHLMPRSSNSGNQKVLFERTTSLADSTYTSRTLVDGDFMLVKLVAHTLVELDEVALTLNRPTKLPPPKTLTRWVQVLRRVPPQTDGDCSSEEESFEPVAYATKPAPLSPVHLQHNPVFEVQKALESVQWEGIGFLQSLKQYVGVSAVQARGYRTLEAFTIFLVYCGYVLLQRSSGNKGLAFVPWLLNAVPQLKMWVSNPHFFSMCMEEVPFPYISPEGPKSFFEHGLSLVQDITRLTLSRDEKSTLGNFTPSASLVCDASPDRSSVPTPEPPNLAGLMAQLRPLVPLTRIDPTVPVFVVYDALDLKVWQAFLRLVLVPPERSNSKSSQSSEAKRAIAQLESSASYLSASHPAPAYNGVLWVSTNPHPVVYVGDKPYSGEYLLPSVPSAVCAALLVEQWKISGPALQLCGNTYPPPPARSPKQAALVPSPPCEPQIRRNSQSRRQSNSSQTKLVLEAFDAAFKPTKVPPIQAAFPSLSKVNNIDWTSWEEHIAEALIKKIEDANGSLSCWVYSGQDVPHEPLLHCPLAFRAIQVLAGKQHRAMGGSSFGQRRRSSQASIKNEGAPGALHTSSITSPKISLTRQASKASRASKGSHNSNPKPFTPGEAPLETAPTPRDAPQETSEVQPMTACGLVKPFCTAASDMLTELATSEGYALSFARCPYIVTDIESRFRLMEQLMELFSSLASHDTGNRLLVLSLADEKSLFIVACAALFFGRAKQMSLPTPEVQQPVNDLGVRRVDSSEEILSSGAVIDSKEVEECSSVEIPGLTELINQFPELGCHVEPVESALQTSPLLAQYRHDLIAAGGQVAPKLRSGDCPRGQLLALASSAIRAVEEYLSLIFFQCYLARTPQETRPFTAFVKEVYPHAAEWLETLCPWPTLFQKVGSHQVSALMRRPPEQKYIDAVI